MFGLVRHLPSQWLLAVFVCKCLHTSASLLVCCFASWIYSSIGDLHMLVIVVQNFPFTLRQHCEGSRRSMLTTPIHIWCEDASNGPLHTHTHTYIYSCIFPAHAAWSGSLDFFSMYATVCVCMFVWHVHVKWFIFCFARTPERLCAASLRCCGAVCALALFKVQTA